tara:strand:+ start:5539 stop:7518 length:1980 start_codon:yes stop_codon:yes gene_type:complete
MSNYTKSFNFRNGVQVDDSNFIVNSVGLVGIGTTRPEKRLDVRGNASITGITNLSGAIISGVVTSGNIKIDSVSGIVTATKFVGDASGLTNIVAIATGGFIANASGLSTTSNIGIGSEAPTTQLDVLGNSIFTGITSFIGLTTTTDLIVQKLDVIGVSTFGNAVDINSSVDVSGSVTLRDDVSISADNKTFKIKTAGSVDKFTVDTDNGNTDIKGTLDVTGVSTFGNNIDANGDLDVDGRTELDITNISETLNVTGVSTFSGNVTVGTSATVGFGTTAYFSDNARAIFGDDEDLEIFHSGTNSVVRDVGTGSLIIAGSTVEIKNPVGTKVNAKFLENSSVELYFNDNLKFETIGTGASVYNQLNVASLNGGASGLSSHFGSLRYGNESGGSPYSTRRSLDLINTDSGNINYYINANDLSNTGNFHWHKGFNTNRLMTLTGIGGSLGIGITLPSSTLHVLGDANVSAGATFGGDIFVAGDVSITGSIEGNVAGNLTGNLTGNVNAASGISTFTNISAGIVTVTSIKTDNIGIQTVVGSNPIELNSGNNKVFISASGNLGIKTDETFGNSIFTTGASVSTIVAVGSTLPKSAVDFADAGKNIPSGAFANKMFMLPPKITTAQRGNLTGVADGALIYNTDGNQLQVYIGGWVGIGTTTKVDS